MLEIYTLLNPKVANYNGTGGIPAITPQDIAACLGRIQVTGPALLVRTMAGDLSSLKPLQQAFRQHVAHMAMLKHWKAGPKYNDYFEGLCESVLHFYIIPSKCGRCEGRGHVTLITKQVIECPVCAGVGNKEVSERSKARVASIPSSTWDDVWGDRYEHARDILVAWEGQADHATKRVFWSDP
jgi:hypothetical protein